MEKTRPSHAQPAQWAKRLGVVRGFARYANAVDPCHEVPPQGLIAYRHRRPRPYIYSDREVADLIAAARGLPGTTGLRPFTYATLLALLAVTGMRTGEILKLDRDGVDLANGVLTVRDGRFFSNHLMQQRQASPHTIASYRDTFRLLVRYAERELNKPPSELALDDFDTAFLGDFLSHLENERGNHARSRNTRLAAIRSFFRHVALHEPQHAALAQRVLAMPSKRHLRSPVAWLDRDEVEALLRAPDPQTRFGRRDRTLLTVAVQTGLRASELIGLRCGDVQLGAGAHVRCRGKGRKERHTPLRRDAAAMLKAWLRERGGEPDDPVFPNQRGRALSHDSLSYLLAKHLATARAACPSLGKKHVTPHCLRHTAAMDLLANGVDRAVIAPWLGHESVETTSVHLHADLELKERAMARTSPSGIRPARYRPEDDLLAFLNGL